MNEGRNTRSKSFTGKSTAEDLSDNIDVSKVNNMPLPALVTEPVSDTNKTLEEVGLLSTLKSMQDQITNLVTATNDNKNAIDELKAETKIKNNNLDTKLSQIMDINSRTHRVT